MTTLKITQGQLDNATKSLAATEKALNESKATLATTAATLRTTTKLLSDTRVDLKASNDANRRLQNQFEERSETPKPTAVEDDAKTAPKAQAAPKAKAADGS